MTKTNAEILEELEGWETEIHPTKTFQAVPLFISEIYTLMDRARAEERKKLLLNNKDNKLNNQIIVNNKPKITIEKIKC